MAEHITSVDSYSFRSLIDTIYPVGIDVSFGNNTDPNTLYPWQTWTKVEGAFIFGADSTHPVGSTGGEEKHTLTVDEIPSHRHQSDEWLVSSTNGFTGWGVQMSQLSKSNAVQATLSAQGTSKYTGYAGGGAAHNNMPPYTAKNIWERQA